MLLSNPPELGRLRASTIAEIERYDEAHDTELLGTLEAFLAHHGSTTETAEAMNLHRHTVGYRLARVQEVSRLSPYESDGRERLSLGLKAHHILLAEQRRVERRPHVAASPRDAGRVAAPGLAVACRASVWTSGAQPREQARARRTLGALAVRPPTRRGWAAFRPCGRA